jgi:hypothetical protein
MPDISVTSKDVDNLVHAIRKHADGKVLRRELNRELSAASKPVREEMREAAIASLPARGGLQAWMAGRASKGRTTNAGGRNAGIRINFAKKGYDPRTLRGRIRHPLYGNRLFWFENTASPVDAIDSAFTAQRPGVSRAVQRAMETVARKVTSQ